MVEIPRGLRHIVEQQLEQAQIDRQVLGLRVSWG